MSKQNAADDPVEKRDGSPADGGSGDRARKSGFVPWLREHLLGVGGMVGAVTAMLTLPGLILSTWNGPLRLIDSWTEPDIAVAVGQLKLRCLIVRPPSDSGQLTLEEHCDPGNLAVSGRFTLTNQDRIARNVTSLRALVRLIGEKSEMAIALKRPLSVRHKVTNGSETAPLSDWMPVDLDPQSTHVQEIAFDQHGPDSTSWQAVRHGMFQNVDDPVWDRVAFTLWATVSGEADELEVFHCTALFKEKHLKTRHNKKEQNRMPFDCESLTK